MTLAEYRKRSGAALDEAHAHDAHTERHPGALEYTQIGAILAVITAFAVAIYYGGVYWLDWHLHPDVIVLCVGLMANYLYAVTSLRARISDAGRVRKGQVALFTSGVFVIFVATGTPIHDLSERYLLSVHMTQHLL